MSGAEDRRLLAEALGRAGQGDRAAFAEVYRRTSAKLFGVCLRILSDRTEAEESLQEVYTIIWTRAGRYDPTLASPITWLATIARNRSIDRLRARRVFADASPEAAEAVPDPADDALTTLTRAEQDGALGRCLGELDERAQGAIRRAFFAGLSYAELAQEQAVPLGTMKSWIRRGLIRLRECLERDA
ncbi:MAG TPA: sigma-70 family RNA polymerase sigma factor [Sphingomonas sp.]|nr:sigma-70 family RNA polymerase sigma factor [Sphingomonas sp.]